MTTLLKVVDAHEAEWTALDYGCIEESAIIRGYIVEMLQPDRRTPALPMPMIHQWTWAAATVGAIALLAAP